MYFDSRFRGNDLNSNPFLMNPPHHLSKKSLIPRYVLSFLLALTAGIYFRLYPYFSYRSQDAADKATLFVLAQVQDKIEKQLSAQYPSMPERQKAIISQKLLNNTLHSERDNVRKTIDRVGLQIHQKTPSKRRVPYLLASDSFYYYYLTENILETGKISATIKGSKFLNPLALAPLGHWEPLKLHPYVGFFIYQFLKLFNPQIDLMTAVSFTPLFLIFFILIVYFLIGYLMSIRPVILGLGALVFLLAPIFIKRSSFGWYDDDPHNILFTFLLLAVLFHSLSQFKYRRASLGCAVLLSLVLSLYAFFWQGWVLMFCLIVVSLLVLLIYSFFGAKSQRTARSLLAYLICFILTTFAAISVSFGAKDFFVLFQEGTSALKDFLIPKISSWPDMYLTVGELQKPPFNEVMEYLGGIILFISTVGGFFLSLVQSARNSGNESGRTYLSQKIILTIFFSVTFVLALKAHRFILLCLIPLSLMSPIALQYWLGLLENIFSRLTLKPVLRLGLLGALFIFFTAMPVYLIQASLPTLLNPIYNETWESALTEIRDKTPPNSIINTWWPPGHFIKAISHRRVTFDGGSINVPQAYWIAQAFLATNEREAVGILRMLNLSANQAAEYLQSLGLPLSQCISIIKIAVSLDETKARTILSNFLKDPLKTDSLLKLTHGVPASSYCLLYNEFVESALQLDFIARWNFKKVEEMNQRPEFLTRVPKPHSKEYINFLWDLVGGPSRVSPPLAQLSRHQDTLLFAQGLKVNLKTKRCLINSKEYGRGTPLSLFTLEADHIVEKTQNNPTLAYCVLLLKEPVKNTYRCLLMDRSLAQSLMISLWYFDAKDLHYFKPVIEASDLTERTQIRVYEIDWGEDEKKNVP